MFKGGTALCKLYFPQIWRFSEDLDFTVIGEVNDLRAQLADASAEIEAISGIQFEITHFHDAGDPVEYPSRCSVRCSPETTKHDKAR